MPQAFGNVIKALKPQAMLPENVFQGAWSHFLFTESDQLFTRFFVEAAREFLNIESATAVCLLNLNRHVGTDFDERALICLDSKTTWSDYEKRLRGDGPADGWLYRVEVYGCASDVGGWCIYCEKEEDVATIALRDADGLAKFQSALAHLQAETFSVICESGQKRFPFSHLTTQWRDRLARNYTTV